MNVRTIMTAPAITVYDHEPIYVVARLMENNRIGSVVVLDDYDRAVGIITDRDIVTRGIAYDVPLDAPVEALMSKRLFVMYEDEEATLAAYFMGAKQVKRIVVLDRDHYVQGIVSIGDLAKSDLYPFQVSEAMKQISYPYSDYTNHPHFGVEVDDFRL